MDFDPTTAKPLDFDPESAKAVEEEAPKKRSMVGQVAKTIFRMTPLGAGLEAGEMLDKAAYQAGGAVTDMASKVLPPEGAAAAGYAANLATQTVPMLAGGGIGAKAAPILERGAERVMQSALKPTLEALKTGKAAKAISTMLEEGYNATSGGVAKLKSAIAELNTQITEAIKNSPAAIDKAKVASGLQGTLKRFEQTVNPQADIKIIEKAWEDFVNHPLLSGSDSIPVQVAQAIKQGTYRELAKKYGTMGSAEVESQKTLARGLKEGIAEAVPEIAGLNAQESKLINALSVAERRALIDANRNIGGLGWLAHNPTAFAMYMADKSALFKSLLARMMYSGSEVIPKTVGQGLGAAEGLRSGRE